jgi:hypothetical protein
MVTVAVFCFGRVDEVEAFQRVGRRGGGDGFRSLRRPSCDCARAAVPQYRLIQIIRP